MVVVHNPTSSPSLYTEVEDLEASSSYSSTAQLLEPNKDKDEEEGGGRRRFNKTTSTSSRWPHHQQQLDPHRSLLASIFSVWHSVALLLVIAFLSIAVIIFCISRASHSSSAPHSHPPITNSSSTTTTLLISIDGCRADYLDRGLTPNLARIAKLGARAAFMIPVFPTLTFPNHYSMVTGLYPESSGIIGNRMWDCETNETFAYGGPSKWWKGEPIWVSAVSC